MRLAASLLFAYLFAAAADEPKPNSPPKHTNRLAKETSPYLLQHAHNPVDWYPWGEEALAKAKKEGKLIFLSIGYSSCHWCHVMERESFHDEEIAKFLNEHFVCIKVDREERPDVDAIYMTALQVYQPARRRAAAAAAGRCRCSSRPRPSRSSAAPISPLATATAHGLTGFLTIVAARCRRSGQDRPTSIREDAKTDRQVHQGRAGRRRRPR